MVDEICKYNIDHVTITINMVDPVVGAKIYPWIFWDHRRVTGIEAATILHRQQMLGLEMLTARGVLTKINSVLIPGINDEHLIEVNREVKKRGAFLHNIMPLISEAEHGTVFGLTGQRGPTRAGAEGRAGRLHGRRQPDAPLPPVPRRCRRACWAKTAARSSRRTRSTQMEVVYDLDKRRAYQEQVEAERQAQHAAKLAALDAAAVDDGGDDPMKVLVAVATEGQGKVNQHFGHATEFQIFEVSTSEAHVRRAPPRRPVLPGRLRRRRAAAVDRRRHQRLPRRARVARSAPARVTN